jgi:hypothetical protein
MLTAACYGRMTADERDALSMSGARRVPRARSRTAADGGG